MSWKRVLFAGSTLLLGFTLSTAQESGLSDDAGRVTALENAWNRALESKDAKALDLIMADSLVAVDTDGSVANKAEYATHRAWFPCRNRWPHHA